MEIKKYIAIVRHWLLLILLGAILAGAVTYIINRNQTPIYRASASFLIDTAPGGRGNDYTEILVAERLTSTYKELISTLPVYEEVVKRMDLDMSAGALRGNVSIDAPLDSQIINVTAHDTVPSRAATIANMVGTVFGEQNTARQSLRYAERITVRNVQLAELEEKIGEVESNIAEFGEATTTDSGIELGRLNRQLGEAQDSYNRIFQSKQELEIEQARSADNFIMVESATAPQSPISPRVGLNTMLATVVGGLLALGIVMLIEHLDDTVKTPDELLAQTGLSTLATIGFIEGDKPSDRLITHKTPRAPTSEAYRVLRTNLSFAAVDTGLKSLLVTSSSPAEGKSTTSANIAVVIAQTGQKVVLVDADLRKPSQHKVFDISNNQGLTTALIDHHTPITQHLQETPVPGLSMMASGPLPPNPAELLSSQRMKDVIASLLEHADFVLIDTPPILSVADAAILASSVDGCALVASVGSTRQDTLSDASIRLTNSGASLFGVVLNRSKSNRKGYYQDSYSDRYYAYEYTHKPEVVSRPRRLLGWLTGASGSRS